MIAILPILLLVGAGVALGLVREPVYKAEARINVGRIDVPAYTLQNVVLGNEAIAAGYARALTAQPVVVDAGRTAGVSPSRARSKLSASPVPGSTLIRVEAKGPSKRESIVLANAGARALIRYIARLNQQQRTTDLLSQFRRARAVVDRVTRRLADVSRASGPRSQKALRARVDLEVAQLRTGSIRDQYRFADSGPVSANLLQLIAPANHSKSDFRSVLQRLILLGLAAGLVLGFGFALLRSNRALLRRSKR